jgi:prepilin-type N-terminal cleavage/methylation domain-containing protein
VTELRNRLRLEGLERRRLVDELSARLDANDVANARQLLNDLAAGAATESPAPTTPARDARSDGFTLIELMITVGLIGLISTIAIPTFIKFQLRTKTSEVKTNLSAILVAEESFFGEYGLYASALPPIPGAVGNAKVSWGLAATDPHGFNRMGFKVEGAGYFQYGVTSNGSTAFTAAGRSDLDGDALYNTWGYVNPEKGTALGVAGPWGTCQAAGVKGPGGGGGNYVERIGPCEPNSGTSEF